MKRKLALVLALVMVLSMIPMMSFAASENRVTKVPTVADDHKFEVAADAPVLRIQEKDADWGVGPGKQVFRLRLENAEWLDSIESVTEATYTTNVSKLAIRILNDTTVEVEVTPETDQSVLLLPMLTEITGSGEAKVTIDPRDSAVTGGTYTFARAATGKVAITSEGTVTFGAGGTADLKAIEIDEVNVGAYRGTKTVRFTLPNDFSWGSNADILAAISLRGGYASSAAPTIVTNDKEILEVRFVLNTTSTRGSIILDELPIVANSKAPFGDVTLRISGSGLDAARFVVAKYVDYSVIAEADSKDVPELIAGRLDTTADGKNDVHELEKLIIKEEVAGSWLPRNTKIEFPEWVKVVGYDIKKSDHMAAPTFVIDENEVEFTPSGFDNTKKSKLEVVFYVTVKPNASGDIVANVSGRGIGAEFDVVLGEALAPITLKTTVEEIVIGKQDQAIGEIRITETEEGMLRRNKEVEVKLPTNFNWKAKPTITVDGDLKVKDIDTKDNTLTFKIDRESTEEPSVIKITNGRIDLLRTPADGEYRVTVGGNALVENNEASFTKAERDDFETAGLDLLWDQNWVARDYVMNVVATATRPAVVFTIGSTTFTVGGAAQQADVAPVVKNSRTFVPIAWSAMALDVEYAWSGSTQTVTLFGDRIVQMTIGSKTMLVNGVPMQMDVAPYIENNRTFVPVAWAATALGVNYTWDNTAKAVTFY